MVSVISLEVVWWLGLGISGLGYLLAGGERTRTIHGIEYRVW